MKGPRRILQSWLQAARRGVYLLGCDLTVTKQLELNFMVSPTEPTKQMNMSQQPHVSLLLVGLVVLVGI